MRRQEMKFNPAKKSDSYKHSLQAPITIHWREYFSSIKSLSLSALIMEKDTKYS